MIITMPDRTQYYVHIEGEGEPVVLLHGFTGSHLSWQKTIKALNHQYQMIAIDLLGHGRSDSPAEAARYSMSHTVEDLFHIFQQLKLESIRLVGYSMGGRVALAFTLHYPKFIKQLVLESSSPGLETEAEREARMASDGSLATRIEQEGLIWFAQFWDNLPLFSSQKKLPLEQQQTIMQSRLNNVPSGLANSLRGIGTGRQASYWDSLTKLDMPVTLIVGEQDEKYVSIANVMKQRLKKVELIEIRQAGHNVHLEQPEQYIANIVSAFQHNE